jgi:hypothetical protein
MHGDSGMGGNGRISPFRRASARSAYSVDVCTRSADASCIAALQARIDSMHLAARPGLGAACRDAGKFV